MFIEGISLDQNIANTHALPLFVPQPRTHHTMFQSFLVLEHKTGFCHHILAQKMTNSFLWY